MSEAARAEGVAESTIPRVSASDRAADDTAFRSLRAHAIQRAQAASGAIWTDYNLHDPGLTMLEAICFALTDLVYQADLPVADHLCGPDGVIDFKRLALFPPQVILPCRPTTADDWRRVVLDQVQALRDARVRPAPDRRRAGLYDVALQRSEGARATWEDCEAAARAAFRERRSLAEDLDGVSDVRIDYYALRLDGVVSGPRDPAEVVAEIYDVCATLLAPSPIPRTIEGLIDEGWALEDIFDGPSVERGVMEPPARRAGAGPDNGDVMVLADLRTELLKIPGLTAVTRLSLVRDDGVEEANRLSWDGRVWAPHLKTPRRAAGTSRAADADVGLIHLRRGSAAVRVSAAEVAASYRDLRAGRDDGRRPDTRGGAGVRLPRGAPRPKRTYFSLQNLLPPIYRLGRHRSTTEPGLLAALHGDKPSPDGVADAHAVQLKGYLSLFDQIIANAEVQIDNIRELLAPARALGKSYRRAVLDNASVPDIRALYAERSPEQVAARIYPPYDDAVERRNRALDFLLSLYGEQYPQNTQRQFLSFLDSVEQARFLLHNKAQFLARIDELTRDRAAGFDYGRDLWSDGKRATPGFHRRIALLLGFADPTARRLASPTSLATPRRASASIDRRGFEDPLPLEWPQRHARVWRPWARPGRAPAPRAGVGIDPATWFELGVDRQNYVWRPAAGGGGVLWMGRDAEDGFTLGAFDGPKDAAGAAQALRKHMLALTAACEGLHVVEHVLLRPRSPGAVWRAGRDALRVTLVFPGWTVRTRREDFRAFAQETAELNCPAHVAIECLWLDIRAMREFEARCARWMAFLRAHRPGEPADELDEAARALRGHLTQQLRRQQRERRAAAGTGGS
jgi:hypothetical protein